MRQLFPRAPSTSNQPQSSVVGVIGHGGTHARPLTLSGPAAPPSDTVGQPQPGAGPGMSGHVSPCSQWSGKEHSLVKTHSCLDDVEAKTT
jgi:hypothetical protein